MTNKERKQLAEALRIAFVRNRLKLETCINITRIVEQRTRNEKRDDTNNFYYVIFDYAGNGAPLSIREGNERTRNSRYSMVDVPSYLTAYSQWVTP